MSVPTIAADGGYEALHTAVGARVVDRDVLSVTGPEALTYLQGQCSQDLTPLAVGGSTEALLLSPQGKVDAWIRVTRVGDESFVLDADAGCGDVARSRLERFKLRTKVTIEPLSWACLSVRGPGATAGGAPPLPEGASLVPAVDILGWSGYDVLGPAPVGDPQLATWMPETAVRCDAGSWEATRIEAGVPKGGREVTESTIAAEVGLVDRTISFTKGCFTGQELVARLDARGSNVARRLYGILVAGEDRPPIGATVWTTDGAHEVGALSSVAWSPGHGATVALATVHRRVVPPERVEVRWDDAGSVHAVGAEVRPLPLGSGD